MEITGFIRCGRTTRNPNSVRRFRTRKEERLTRFQDYGRYKEVLSTDATAAVDKKHELAYLQFSHQHF